MGPAGDRNAFGEVTVWETLTPQQPIRGENNLLLILPLSHRAAAVKFYLLFLDFTLWFKTINTCYITKHYWLFNIRFLNCARQLWRQPGSLPYRPLDHRPYYCAEGVNIGWAKNYGARGAVNAAGTRAGCAEASWKAVVFKAPPSLSQSWLKGL